VRREALARYTHHQDRATVMSLPDPSRRQLDAVLARPDREVDLAQAALLVAAEEYPGLDVRSYLVRLDEMGCALRQRLEDEPRPERAVMALNRYLFQEQGFRGNTERYYDPRNSYLNEVLDRRTGIPITLSTVYIEVARRGGLDVEGVGLPGHFIVRIQNPGRPLLVDPFHGGTMLTARDCQEMLQPCPRRDMLERMLRNLKAVYIRDQDVPRALRVVDLLVRIQPGNAEDLRDRGILFAALDCYAYAARDIEAYLTLVPKAPDAKELAPRLAHLQEKAARLN
jgi:regulator of sirC expression with transglutaminase-like and TPR domain